jgi:hypothetical protein
MLDPLDSTFFDAGPPGQRGPRPLLRFFSEAVELPGESAKEGRPVFVNRDFVGITNPGSRDEVVRRAEDKAKEDEFIAWAYRKWKTTQEQPVSGTPLDTVPFLNKAQVAELRAINVATLEQLAELSDTAKQRMMGSVALQKKAKAFMESAKDTAIVTRLQGELEQRDSEIAMLKKQMADMGARFDEMAKKVLT